jgi:hypothetical protein
MTERRSALAALVEFFRAQREFDTACLAVLELYDSADAAARGDLAAVLADRRLNVTPGHLETVWGLLADPHRYTEAPPAQQRPRLIITNPIERKLK